MNIAQQIVNGLVLGSGYACVALGWTILLGVARLVNFAHGQLYMLGAFVTWYAGGPAPMLSSDPDSEDTFTILPALLFRNSGRKAWHMRHGPSRFVVIVSITVRSSAFSAVSHVS